MNKKLSTKMCLLHARMLVPKFGYVSEGTWYIHWPVDQPHVVHAQSEEKLIIALAAWLKELNRIANQGKHIEPD